MRPTLLPNLAAAALLLASGVASAQGRSIDELAAGNANKRIALEYLDLAWTQGKRDEARAKFFAPAFRNHPAEHAPRRAAAARPPAPVRVTYEFRQAIAEGDFVVVHSMVRGFGIGAPIVGPFGNGGAKLGDDVVDIFKIENGKIVAKSDTVQASDSEDLFIDN